MKHLTETELALMAGGDTGWFQRVALQRHLRGCAECQDEVAVYEALREERICLPDLNWDELAAEMRANIHLGLEAGACVQEIQTASKWNPRLAVAFACLAMLVGASFWLRPGNPIPAVTAARVYEAPRLESTRAGLELRTGLNSSLTLLNHEGAAVSQTVSAQGAIRARNIDGNTGSVTINNVYLE